MNRRIILYIMGMLVAAGWSLPVNTSLAAGPPKPPIDITVGLQRVGTAGWEIEVLKMLERDKANGVNLIIRELASKQAGHVALLAKDVDVILADFLWVATQRAAGERIAMVPHSKAVGGLLYNPAAPIASLSELPGKTIAIAGGPLDKSWIALQAYYEQETGETLADKVEAKFGGPPLVKELLINGQVDAALNFWHFNARAKSAGMVELISVADMMDAMNIDPQPPLLGWAFRDRFYGKERDAVSGFLNASFQTKERLLQDDAIWEKLRTKMRAEDDDDMFIKLRDDYRKGIVPSNDPALAESAAASYAIMADIAGSDLVGDTTELPDGTFWAKQTHR